MLQLVSRRHITKARRSEKVTNVLFERTFVFFEPSRLRDVQALRISCCAGVKNAVFRKNGDGMRGQLAAGIVVACMGLLVTIGWIARAADPTRFLFVARVQNVYDPGEALKDAIQVGDLLRGTVTYDSAARDSDPLPTMGRYEHHQAPFGISIEAGPFIVQTDPARVDFSIVISNDHGIPPHDSYLLTSRNNLPLANGAAVSRISWELVDDSLEALDSTALPLTAPDLTKWRSEFGLTIDGHSTVEFIIRAHVIEATLCTPETRCPSPR
jgi:hypothetical protein